MTPQKNSVLRIHILWVIYLVLNLFINSIKCWRTFNCTGHLSPGSQESHFWKLKIRHHNCPEIKFVCSKFYLQILEEIHKKLSDIQQFKDERENNVQKMVLGGSRAKDNNVLASCINSCIRSLYIVKFPLCNSGEYFLNCLFNFHTQASVSCPIGGIFTDRHMWTSGGLASAIVMLLMRLCDQ